MKKLILCVAAGLSLTAPVASAEEARIGGCGRPSHERRTTVIRERGAPRRNGGDPQGTP